MSKLKAGVIRTPHNEGMSFSRDSDHVAVTEDETEFYLKSEVDKVICHQKYKRCLNMAKWCFTKANYHFRLARSGEDSKENIRKDARYTKWRYRWLELAKQFKEAVNAN